MIYLLLIAAFVLGLIVGIVGGLIWANLAFSNQIGRAFGWR